MTSFGDDRNLNVLSRSPKTKAEFRVSLKQLTTHPSESQSTDLVLSSENLKDVERGLPDNDGPFDLRDCLTSSNEANKAAGIPPKHVGVIWEGLQVIVGGDKDHKVSTCFAGV